MIQSIFYISARGLGVYILLLILTRLMGRKLISQMTFFDFVVGITLGTAGASMAIGPKNSYVSTTTIVIVFSILTILSGYITIKSSKLRKLFASEPVTIIDKGTIVEPNMKNIRLSINELMMKLREKNIFNVADVEFALMETDGNLSVLPKPDKQPLTPSHMNIPTSSKGLSKDIIMDGNIMEENLKEANLNKDWLLNQLNSQGIQDESQVFYAGIDNTNTLFISRKKIFKETHGKYGIE